MTMASARRIKTFIAAPVLLDLFGSAGAGAHWRVTSHTAAPNVRSAAAAQPVMQAIALGPRRRRRRPGPQQYANRLHGYHAVDQAVVILPAKRPASTLEAFDQHDLPQWPLPVQREREDSTVQSLSRPESPGAGSSAWPT